uniref:Retrovirus-related Pol polyprotein from transposon TNT 1-94 n=1 Tax=Tanacetum cinerariifolium TaxID=118510 RepID=A0A6L2KJQ8_TANCI|nr:retrovirus-related Pol polyprotein from transposon TNT 1-94 [Tanacetum cinerariifolium]
MLIFSRAPLFLWAEAIATTCFTQNRSIIHRRFNKTPYELINDRKPNILFLHVFGALCYPKNDREDIGKLGAKGDIGSFIGYFADSCAYRIYNQRTKKIMETMNVLFDELSAMAFVTPLFVKKMLCHNHGVSSKHRKGKKKVVDEQAAHDLLTLQTSKNKSPVDQFVFQWRTPMPTKASRPDESPSLDAELALTDSEIKSDDVVLRSVLEIKMKARLDQTLVYKMKARLDQTLENLKLASKDPVIPEEPASSTGTLSSLQNLEKELSFTDQFFVEKQQEEEPGKTAESEVSKAVDEIVTDALDWAMQAPLRARFNQLLSDLEEARQKKRKRCDVPRTPFGSPPPQSPPLPSPAGTSGASGNKAPSSSKSAASAPQSMAWTTSNIRYESAGLSETQKLSPTDSLIPDDSILDEQATALVSAYETPAENSLLAKTGDITNFLNRYYRQVNKTMLTPADLERKAYEVLKHSTQMSFTCSSRWRSVIRCSQTKLTG